MFKSFIPFCHAKSLYEIDPTFFTKFGIKTLFIDLDNTLDSFKAKQPKQSTLDYIERIKNQGITPVIISNNKPHRVCNYANALGIEFLASAKKPFSKRILAELKRRGLENNDVMLVGDQMMTDVLAGKNCGIKVVLTEKIVKEDQWTTHINRLVDKPIRKYHKKKNNLVEWRDL